MLITPAFILGVFLVVIFVHIADALWCTYKKKPGQHYYDACVGISHYAKAFLLLLLTKWIDPFIR
jgi:hypothetical protein